MPKAKKKKRSERAIRTARHKRILACRFARLIIAAASVAGAALKDQHPRNKYPTPPSYYKVAQDLQIDRKYANVADEIYNDVNGPDDWSFACEERAMERCQDLLTMELEDDDDSA